MYPGSISPKKTLVGLPVRNIDYGTLHKSLRMTDRDVKRNLQPEFLESLGKMCLSSTGRSEVGLKPEGNRDSAISHLDNGSRDVKERESSPLLNVSITSPNALNNSCELQCECVILCLLYRLNICSVVCCKFAVIHTNVFCKKMTFSSRV